MAEEKKNGNGNGNGEAPPKIRLSFKPGPGATPPVAPLAKPKGDTSRVDLAAAELSSVDVPTSAEPLSIREVIRAAAPAADVKAATSRVSLSDSQKLAPGDQVPVAKSSTSRIRLDDARPLESLAEAKAITSRIKLQDSQRVLLPGAKDGTTRIRLEPVAATPVVPAPPAPPMPVTPATPPKSLKDTTSRIKLQETQAVAGEAPKDGTTRVRLQDSQPVPPKSLKDTTSRIKLQDSQVVPVEAYKDGTTHISLDGMRRLSPEEEAELAKNATIRVDLTGLVSPDQRVPGSPYVATAAEAIGDANKNRTARIAIEGPMEVPTGGSLGQTAPIPTVAPTPSAGVPPPKTVRLQRPAAAPKTVVLKRPEAPAEGVAPKTVVLKRPEAPGEPAAPKTVVLKKPGEEQAEGKGTTARISVPEAALEAAPPTQRKTIRIKRVEGGAPSSAARLQIARAAPKVEAEVAPEAPPAEAAAKEQIYEALGVKEKVAPDEPGAFFGIMAIAAALILGALIYVLAAQTIAPTLSFPGKIM